MKKAIGILGGTFDPVHYGHLRLAIECLERLELREVRLVPLHTPPHRQSPVATPEQRLAMLKLATDTVEGIHIDESELHREDVSYTVDTISALRQKLGETPVCLIMGADAFETLPTWRDWQSLTDYVHIVIAARNPDTNNALNNAATPSNAEWVTDSQSLHDHAAGKLFQLSIPLLDIAATQIRENLANGRNMSGLLPEAVLDFIYTHKLYTT